MKQNQTPQPLTVSEAKELKFLNDKIFQGSSFVILDPADENLPEVKRYDELLRKKMAYLQYMAKLVACN